MAVHKPKEASKETLELLQKFAQEKALDVDKMRTIVAELVSIRDRLLMINGHMTAIHEAYNNELSTVDSFVRAASELGELDLRDLMIVHENIQQAVKRLMRIDHGRTEEQTKTYIRDDRKMGRIYADAGDAAGERRFFREEGTYRVEVDEEPNREYATRDAAADANQAGPA